MKNKLRDISYCGVRREKIENAKPVLSKTGMRILHEFITERYAIHKKKDVEKTPAPWTENEVFLKYKFTNVRREHDRETLYLIDNILGNPNLSYEDKIFNCILFRLYNKGDTHKLLGDVHYDTFNPEDYREKLKNVPEGYKHFTSAFNCGGVKYVSARYLPGEEYIPMRVMNMMQFIKEQKIVERIVFAGNQEDVFNILTETPGIGNFLGYQMFVDMTYMREFPFSENEFVVAGPGCKKGLNIIFKDRHGMNYEEALFWLRDKIGRVFDKLDLEWEPDVLFDDLPEHDRHMNVMSLENCMCEMCKYYPLRHGQRKRIKRYRGGQDV